MPCTKIIKVSSEAVQGRVLNEPITEAHHVKNRLYGEQGATCCMYNLVRIMGKMEGRTTRYFLYGLEPPVEFHSIAKKRYMILVAPSGQS